MSVVGSDYDKLKRYNISEIYSPTPRPQPKQKESKEAEHVEDAKQSKDSVETGQSEEPKDPEVAEAAGQTAHATDGGSETEKNKSG